MHTFSSVSRPVWTIESAISIQGIRPEYVALVYPYVTFFLFSAVSRREQGATHCHELQTELPRIQQLCQKLQVGQKGYIATMRGKMRNSLCHLSHPSWRA